MYCLLGDFRKLVARVRSTRGPVLCVMAVERLTSHTNADDDSVYRAAEDIARLRETSDPVRRLRAALMVQGGTANELACIDNAVQTEVRAAAEAASITRHP